MEVWRGTGWRCGGARKGGVEGHVKEVCRGHVLGTEG